MKHFKKILTATYFSCSFVMAAAADDGAAMAAMDYAEFKEVMTADWKTLLRLKSSASSKDKEVIEWIALSQAHAAEANHMLSSRHLGSLQRRTLELFMITVNHVKAVTDHENTLEALPNAEQRTFETKRPTAWKEVCDLNDRIINEDIKSPRIKELFGNLNSAAYKFHLLNSKPIETDHLQDHKAKDRACQELLINEVIPAQEALNVYLDRDDLTEEEKADADFLNLFEVECSPAEHSIMLPRR